MKNFNIISANPIIYTFNNFIDEMTIKDLMSANNNYKKSETRKTNANNLRKSFVASLDNNMPIADLVYENLQKKLYFKLSKIEGLQIQKYKENYFYKPHFDTNTSLDRINSKDLDLQRRFSIILYLNDDFEGGETYFPHLDITIHPKACMVVVFENCIRETNFPNPLALHEGKKITRGTKFILNSWSYESEYINTFKHKINMQYK